eukprot:4318552-Heterocapsa_arctica.AAC.1
MSDAVLNGRRKRSADAELRRCVKETLNYRLKWDTKYTVAQKAKRASDGCSRFHPGAHFPKWKYGVDVDPYKDGMITENPLVFAEGAPPSKMSKALYAGVICDDIEVTPGYDQGVLPCANEMTENP